MLMYIVVDTQLRSGTIAIESHLRYSQVATRVKRDLVKDVRVHIYNAIKK